MAAAALLSRIGAGLDRINAAVGSVVMWFAVGMMLIQFAIVVLRYVFGMSFIFVTEAEMYLHAALFMLGAGYTLLHDGHVRVDIFYGSMTRRRKAVVDLLGTVFFLLPTCGVILFYTWPYVRRSWQIMEGAISVGGIPASFLLKSLIPAFAVLLIVQGIAMALRNLAVLLGRDADGEGAAS
ncbi:TRAP transporter small permease subunit [Caenispirillum bisanense]|uniref:TRAP transporter small permease protein n=1 Tax=Caenispirillum bisanense TaxID=414052 RepID=A0A286H0I6_9PROT|nr:TRAP transporter small permease subunit [Caenispirillum bisanense]SOE00814.1 TRAP-type mannitol/chloroaromatic compound transport system, small permease component [Caenispirillum bisanense]